jgi:hypothetical protein
MGQEIDLVKLHIMQKADYTLMRWVVHAATNADFGKLAERCT